MGATATAIASIGSAGFGIAAANSQASATRAQGRFARQQAEFNARQSEKQALDAKERGKKRAELNQQQTQQLIGDQRATLAAQGIVVDEGTAAALQEQTKDIGLEDSITIRNNAMREAFGFEQQAYNFRTQGALTQAGANVAAANTQFAGSVRAFGTLASTASDLFKDRDTAPTVSTKSPVDDGAGGGSFSGRFDSRSFIRRRER